MTSGLAGSDEPLRRGVARLLVDLDGVVMLGEQPVDHAPEALAEARDEGVTVRFVTNNASRTPEDVAERLTAMGVAAAPDEVTTSAVAGAARLAADLAPGSAVLVVGGAGVRAALSAAGLRPVDTAGDEPVAVLQGFSADVGWRQLAEAAVAIRAGARWVATNLDRTLPSPRGPLPGNGSLVVALSEATGNRPEAVGKPERALYDAARGDADPDGTLMVGDRLDTDVAGARAAGLRSLLVLSGVSRPADLVRAAGPSRPDYVGADLRALGRRHPPAGADRGPAGVVATCAGSRVEVAGGEVTVTASAGEGGSQDEGSDGLDGLRALAAACWAAADAGDALDDASVDAALREVGAE